VISRVAENCFWLHRYVERLETTARLVSINRMVILDAGIHEAGRWKPIIAVVGEQERFEALVGKRGYDRDEEAEEYLTWSEENPTSIRSSLAGARENARMTREVVSREMWETLNTAWQWLNGPAARREFKKDRPQFHMRLRRVCAEFQGDTHSTMLRDQPFLFMRLGFLLERASQTARVMAVKRHWSSTGERSPYESAQWMGLLRLCVAVEPFFKRNAAAPTGPRVADFILRDVGFPRSVLHCLVRSGSVVERIDADTRRTKATKTRRLLRAETKRLQATDAGSLDSAELTAELDRIIAAVADICDQAYADFFDPTLRLTRPS